MLVKVTVPEVLFLVQLHLMWLIDELILRMVASDPSSVKMSSVTPSAPCHYLLLLESSHNIMNEQIRDLGPHSEISGNSFISVEILLTFKKGKLGATYTREIQYNAL